RKRTMNTSGSSQWMVMKLGGTSVSKAAWWDNAAAEIRAAREAGLRVLVVQSALTGVTDLLEKLLESTDDATREDVLGEITARHRALAREMGIDAECIAPYLER